MQDNNIFTTNPNNLNNSMYQVQHMNAAIMEEILVSQEGIKNLPQYSFNAFILACTTRCGREIQL